MESEDDGCYILIVDKSNHEECTNDFLDKLFPLMKEGLLDKLDQKDSEHNDHEIELDDNSDKVTTHTYNENPETISLNYEDDNDGDDDGRKSSRGEEVLLKPRGELKDSVEAFVKALLKEEQKGPPMIPSKAYIVTNNEFECSYCPYRCEYPSKAKRHYRFKHGNKYNKCLACNKTFRRRYSMLFHETYCSSPLGNVLRIAREVVVKLKASRPKKKSMKAPCVVCKKLVTNGNMSTHMRVHSNEKRFHCDHCPAKYRSKRAMTAHLNAHMGKRPYDCNQCSNVYTSYTALQTHKLDHGDRNFRCIICDRAFRRKHSLQLHLQTHGDGNGFLCPLCGKKFNNSQYLDKHVNRHSESAKVDCVDCGKQYSCLTNLNYHMKRQHKKEIITRKTFFNRLPRILNSETHTLKVVQPDDKPDILVQVSGHCNTNC